MADITRKLGPRILACVLIVAALLVLTMLFTAAREDASPAAWKGRAIGFAMSFSALAVGAAMAAVPRAGKMPYWGFVALLTFAALLTGAYSYKPTAAQMGQRAELIPFDLGAWRGVRLKVDEANERVLMTTDIIMRRYSRGDEHVQLAVVFAESKRKVAHPPEQCYASSGQEIESLVDDSFTTKEGRTITARRLVILKRGIKQAVLYWFKAGDYSTGNFARQQFHVILSNLMLESDVRVGLIRLSTIMAKDEPVETAMTRLKDFAQELYPEVEKALE